MLADLRVLTSEFGSVTWGKVELSAAGVGCVHALIIKQDNPQIVNTYSWLIICCIVEPFWKDYSIYNNSVPINLNFTAEIFSVQSLSQH